MGQLDGQGRTAQRGASDIGRATAQLLAAEGAAVAVGDVSPKTRASSGGGDRGAREDAPSACVCDVRDEESVGAFVGRAVAEFGGVDCRRPQRRVESSATRHRCRRRRPRRVGTCDRDHDPWRPAAGAPCDPGDGDAGRRLLRHDLVRHEHDRRVDAGGLRRLEGGAQPAHPPPGRPLRARRHPRQRHRPGLHPHRHRRRPRCPTTSRSAWPRSIRPVGSARPPTSVASSCSCAATPRPT